MNSSVLTRNLKPQIDHLSMERDWPEIQRLMEAEDWPFVRADLEVSHAQPRAIGRVARRGESDKLAGFFVAHHFNDVGYFDMMVVDPDERRTKLATRLGFETDKAMRQQGMRGFVAHSTNDSFDVFRFFGFDAGADFTLLRRDSLTTRGNDAKLDDIVLAHSQIDSVIALDAKVFGQSRRPWIDTLIAQPSTRFVGVERDGQLVASVTLRERRDNTYCLDAVNALNFADLEPLLSTVVAALPHRRLECFALSGSNLDHWLRNQNWHVPDFFQRIGPLVEWRKGRTAGFGDTPHIRSLNWF